MRSEDENMKLENEAPFLAKVNKENPFNTPDGYFDNLSEQLISELNIKASIDQSHHFDVPAGYFENLSEQIIATAQLHSQKTTAEEQHDFNVPDHYFEKSKENILAKVGVKNTGKSSVIKLHFIRYAAAACILLTTSLGIYVNIKNETSVSTQLSKIPAKDIEAYLNQHTDASDLPMLIENIDEESNLNIDDFDMEHTN